MTKAADVSTQPAKEAITWWAKGLLFENCSCQLLCRAHVSFKQQCDGDLCIGHWGVHIAEGRYEDFSISGLNAVVIYDSPVRMYEGHWRQRLYIDERGSAPQRLALEAILSGRGGGPWEILGQFVSNRLETRFTPVIFADAEDTKRMTVPGVFDTTVSAIRGGDGAGHAILSNLYNVIHGVAHVLARGTTRCGDDAFDFKNEKTHGLYSDFSWEGESTGV